ncbi:hypothetical protein ABZ319_29540 [Nocardia sp. NPDC005978]|uniref:hypothetical protein n=1 Tax=Nocardia sp. NPDC005978 TaxID=3156725 RepID=UPI0033B74FB7
MWRKTAVWWMTALSAVALTACTGPAEPESTVATTETSGAPDTDPVTGMTPCGDIGSAATPPDCVLRARDGTGLVFEVRHAANGSSSLTTIIVRDSDGEQVQTITEKGWRAAAGARLRDLDADGRDELIIPLFLATANASYAIYHAGGGSLEYRRAGQLGGIGIDTSDSGYTVASARAGYAAWDVQFWTFVQDRLHPVVTAQVRPIEGSDGKVAGTTCAVVDSGGLDDLGLSASAATAQFCAEPTVVRVMRN